MQMNLKHSLIQELVLYMFKLGYNAMEETKNICCVKCEGAVDHSSLTRWLKKFFYHKKFDNQARIGWPKTVDSEAVFKL